MAQLTVLFDEGCDVCTRIAARLAAGPGVEVAAIGSETGSLLLRDLTPPERYASVHVVDRLGRRASGGAALAPLLRELRGGSALAAVCEALPGPVERGYAFVARNRWLLTAIARPLGSRRPGACSGPRS